jgi:tetratricopeptide (TPR) repeat protein
LDAALATIDEGERERRAEILVDLAEACWWSLDVPAMLRPATEARALAGQLGRGDLETEAMAWLAEAESSAGNLPACVEQNQRAIDHARALGIPPPAVAVHYTGVTQYWLGRLDEAVESSAEALATARASNDISWIMLSLPHLGAALAGTGRYAEATRVFDEAQQLGREYGIENLRARSLAWSAGFHLDLFDYTGAESLAREARDLCRSLKFPPSAASAGIDLLLNYARQQEVGRTEQLIDEVAAVAEQTRGFHGWLWRMRLAEARAEIALARGDAAEALRWAGGRSSRVGHAGA